MEKWSIWKILFRLAILICSAWYVLVYGYVALQRSRAQHCEREVHGKYIAERCMLGPEFWMVFRLYDAQSGKLLAERTYDDPTFPVLIWENDRVYYDLSPKAGEGSVTLPPSWLDGWRARLP